ncbi:MAG: Hsp20/alpha crystallin family protein, partial [Thermoproteota archaeon]
IEEIETRREEEEAMREPVLDVMDFGDEIVVVAEIPGVSKEDIDVSATERRLTIRAKPYSAKVDLPAEVRPEGAKATYSNGILEVRLPKKEGKRAEVREKKVKVE